MLVRKRDWWWDVTLGVSGGCRPVPGSPGCVECFVPAWNNGHPHKSETVHTGVIKKVKGRWFFNGEVNILRDGDPQWSPLTLAKTKVKNSALGPDKPLLIWPADLSDLFIEDCPDHFISRVIATIVQSGHICLLLTKRTARMAAFFAALDPRTAKRWQSQVWLGFSAENQEWFDRRWADMCALAKAGWFIFVSLAPLLGPVTLPPDALELLRWVIVAGKQRVPGTRPRLMKAAWARAIHEQCKAAGIPFFMKQMAGGAPRPRDLRIRDFPSVP
jgi:protein gp37